MNIKMIKALKDKYIYVDIDGALVEHRFNNRVGIRDNTNNRQTIEEIKTHDFLNNRPSKSIIKTLKRVRKHGIWTCSTISSPIELEDKVVWLNRNCSDIEFNGRFWFVHEEHWDTFLDYFNCSKNNYNIVTQYGVIIKGSKNCMWDWIVNHNLHKLEETVFVDDLLSYLIQAEEKGVSTYFIE